MSAEVEPSSIPAWVQDLFEQGDEARRLGRTALALAIYRRVVAAAPQFFPARQHLGALLTILGRRAEAEPELRAALVLSPQDPTVRHALGTTLLAQGRYAEGWPLYEARHEIAKLSPGKPKDFAYPEWRGEDLTGKRLLIFPEQGLGDQIQYARFALELARKGVEVWLLARPELARLFEHSFPEMRVLAAAGNVEFPDPDAWTLSSSLPGLVGVSLESLPTAPYLRAPSGGPELAAGFKVGLMTAGSPAHPNDPNRSLSEADAGRLRAGLPGQVIDLAPAASGARDMADTASLIAQLDLVVTVDTSVAHLAGALGAPSFVLTPGVNTDWRWMQERTDSPWYPSLRLYRGDRAGRWDAAIDQLLADARARAERDEATLA